MITKFINRDKDIDFLESKYHDHSPQVIILYGRRRVGKSSLIQQFMKNKQSIYYLASRTVQDLQISDFIDTIKRELNDEQISDLRKNWEVIFKYLAVSQDRIVIAIDEIPYLIESDKALTSTFQRIIDLYIAESNLFLILCGSSIGMMESEVLGYKSPLYGRRTGQWKLEPMRFKQITEFLPRYSPEELIYAYTACGGIPFYINKFDDSMDVFENIHGKILRKGEVLNEEAEFLLKEELREPKTYFSILRAISFGNTKFSGIMNYTGIDKNSLTRYLDILRTLGLVRRDIPVTEKSREKSKKGLYYIDDNYLNFWFRFIFPYRSELEENPSAVLNTLIKPYYNQFVGHCFEDISKQFLQDLNAEERLPFEFLRIGRWWHREKEIDLIALNDETKEILLMECKWQELTKNEALKVLGRLKDKSKYVQWNNIERTEYSGIIAKKITQKEELRKSGVIAFDLEDF
ncbi:MAG: ATP-binding protein [Methanosarcinales archaeon]